MGKTPTDTLLQLLGIELSPVSHTERIVSAVGGFLGIYAILQISFHYVGPASATLIVASMGATAVLLFAVPHGPLAQPWPVIGGHLCSAVVGVTCARYIPDTLIAGAVAVGLAIGVMHYLRCIHPPGGATALSAVVGGAGVHALGYRFVLTPVLINVLVIFLVAVVFNFPFAWRRYPAYLKELLPAGAEKKAGEGPPVISHEDLVYALSEVDSFVDISEQDLLAIYDLATRRIQRTAFRADQLQPGHYYSNGKYGTEWVVRQIIDESGDAGSADAMVIFKVVAGSGLRSTGVLTRREFARWAAHEVFRDDENWRRVPLEEDR